MGVRSASSGSGRGMAADELIETALGVLAERLQLHIVDGPTTHVAIAVTGLDDADVRQAIGVYLVGVIAGGVGEDARLSQELLARTPESWLEVKDHVLRLISTTNTFTTKAGTTFRDTTRNPWIAEVLAHAILVLRTRRECTCIEGEIRALKQPHPDPKRQGLDIVAIYEADGVTPVLAVGEAKASRAYGPQRVNDTVTFFADIDDGRRGVELRQVVHGLKNSVPEGLRDKLADGFWRDSCCYVPIVVHSEPAIGAVDHEGLGGLRPGVRFRRLIAPELDDFYGFFDDVADSARAMLDQMLAEAGDV
jgi:hypothetical protein